MPLDPLAPASWQTVHCPAKINWMLSVHGKRSDGFHDLTSLMVALAFGDRLSFREVEGSCDQLSCLDPRVPTGPENLILRAAESFRRATGMNRFFEFQLEKRIPMGAGLGGGSSDAVATLKGLNADSGHPLDRAALIELAAELGSDCPFFVEGVPALIEGRGERLTPLPEDVAARLQGRKLLLIGPPFAINTAWAYRHLAQVVRHYEDAGVARRRLDAFFSGGPDAEILFNSFEAAVGEKYLALPALLDALRAQGYPCLMSGSGSVCFVLVGPEGAPTGLQEQCREAWGSDLFCVETEVLGADYACAARVFS